MSYLKYFALSLSLMTATCFSAITAASAAPTAAPYQSAISLYNAGNVLRRGEGAPMGPNFGNIIESL